MHVRIPDRYRGELEALRKSFSEQMGIDVTLGGVLAHLVHTFEATGKAVNTASTNQPQKPRKQRSLIPKKQTRRSPSKRRTRAKKTART